MEGVRALINFDSKVNAITPAFVAGLGVITRATNVVAQKIHGSPLDLYGIASAGFLLKDSLEKVRFFEETFLLADTNVEVVSRMTFVFLRNADFQFDTGKLTWRSYIVAEALLTTRQVEFIDKKEFTKAAPDKNSKVFVVHVAASEASKPAEMPIHPSRATQIASKSSDEPTLPALKWNEAPTEILSKYSDYARVF